MGVELQAAKRMKSVRACIEMSEIENPCGGMERGDGILRIVFEGTVFVWFVIHTSVTFSFLCRKD